MYVFGAVFVISAGVIYKFKNEHSKNNLEEMELDARLENASAQKLSLLNAYKVLYKLLQLKSVRLYALVLITMSVG